MTKLLIVDDRQQDLYLLQVLLSSNGYEIELANNGAEALELARRAPPDMIISDILMPVMDGFSLCRTCKEDEGLKGIPFIFYTATYTDVKDEDFAMSLGADRFIVKPAEPDKFLVLLRETIDAHAAGKVAAPREPIEEVTEYYKKYNAALIRKLESKMLQLQQAHQRLAILYQASNELAALKSAAELVLTALRASVGTVDFAQAIYFHYDEKQGHLYLLDAVGISDQALAAFKAQEPFAPGEERGLVGLVAQTCQPIIVPDASHEVRWIPIDATIRSALFVPVAHEQHLLGVVAVLSRQARDYDEDDAHNLTTLANNLAIAIENTRLFEQVQKSELYYRTILESSADAILGIDSDFKITVWNSGAEKVFGYSKEESIGQSLRILIVPHEKSRTEEALREAHEKGSVYGFQTHGRAKDGRQIYIEMTVTYLGPGLGYTAILRDITERKQKEQELETVAVISAALRVAQSRAEMLPIILEQLMILIRADGACFVLRDQVSGSLVMELAIGEFANGTGYRFVPGEGVSESIMQSGQPYLSNQVHGDLRFARRDLLEKIGAMVGVPLIAREETIGVLWIGKTDYIHEHEVRLLGAIADIAANAIQRATLHEQAQRFAHELALAYDTTIEGWSNALDMRDRETEGHTMRVTEMTLRLARAAGMTEDELVHARRGALLHDIGKMGIPDSILLKPDKLTDEEWVVMKRHPVYAYELLSPIEYLRLALEIPYCHHEMWDGSGYPRGLTGEQIPFIARLFAVVDVWDALSSDRPYRPRWSEDRVRAYIQAQAGTHFDPQVVELFFRVLNGRA